ncbi:hypothetical protein AA313_de0202100 [Arthrobotrys entomopaga]|nr:hypothetical protein AA313_de0202100 [Arthrobotrys entomopaga]
MHMRQTGLVRYLNSDPAFFRVLGKVYDKIKNCHPVPDISTGLFGPTRDNSGEALRVRATSVPPRICRIILTARASGEADVSVRQDNDQCNPLATLYFLDPICGASVQPTRSREDLIKYFATNVHSNNRNVLDEWTRLKFGER